MRYVSFALPGARRLCSKRRPPVGRPQLPLYFGVQMAQSNSRIMDPFTPMVSRQLATKSTKKHKNGSSVQDFAKQQHPYLFVPFCFFRGYQRIELAGTT